MAVRITYFVHGTTTDNEAGLATGWLQGALSDLGLEQAKELGKQVADQTFDAFISSDLQRAMESAIFGFAKKYAFNFDKRLRECNYGDYNGQDESFKADMKPYIEVPFPSGESYRDVERRIHSLLDELSQDYQGKHIALMAHQAPQLALEVLLNHKSWEQAITDDWRHTKSWQAGWEYIIPDDWAVQ